MKQFKLMALYAAMCTAGIVGIILMMKYPEAFAVRGALGASMMLTGAMTVFGAIGVHLEMEILREQKNRIPFFKGVREYIRSLSLKEKFLLALGLVSFLLIFGWLAVMYVAIFTEMTTSLKLHVISIMGAMGGVVTLIHLADNRSCKENVRTVWTMLRYG